jgi:biopolymer transport protein ExbD/biopolymer transport protein TolR
MGMSVGGKRGIVSEMNVVPLIDILLVLLVIFMIIPVYSKGEEALIPQASAETSPAPPIDEVVVIQVLADGTLKINQESVTFDKLGPRIEEIFKQRATRVAFIRGDRPVEFGVVANVIDVMHTSGIASVGLLTPDLEKGF